MKKMITLLLLIAGSLSAMPKDWTLETAPTITSQGCSLFESEAGSDLEYYSKYIGIHNEHTGWSYAQFFNKSGQLTKSFKLRTKESNNISKLVAFEVSPEEIYAAYQECMQAAATRK